MGRILAIDFGTKRCGIAVTDQLQLIASGLTTVPTGELMSFLSEYLRFEDVETVVIGEPRQKDGSSSAVETEIQSFLKSFSASFPNLKLVRADERFTSKMAFQSMIHSGMKKKKRQEKGLIDEISATLILQGYLQKTNKE